MGRAINNFGDLLGPLIVRRVLAMHNIDSRSARYDRRLLSIGSVLHFARDGDVIWGTGVNGKKSDIDYTFQSLDVRAVRGPRTREFLIDRGVAAPGVYGDPALLLPVVAPELARCALTKRYPLTVVPNFNDLAQYGSTHSLLDPRSPIDVCLRRIAHSELVVGSSLHAIIAAESLGIPARVVSSPVEDRFKYEDYYLGTGRGAAIIAESVDEAVEMGGERAMSFDATRLLRAFPLDLWRS